MSRVRTRIPDPRPGDYLNNPSHSGLHAQHNADFADLQAQIDAINTASVALANPVGRFKADTQADANAVFVEEIDRRVGGDGVTDMVYLTQKEYDQITPDPQTVYVIEE